jgi:hypothetical protein
MCRSFQLSGAVLFLFSVIGRLTGDMCLDPLTVFSRRHIHVGRAEYLTGLGTRARTGTTSQYNAAHQSQGSDLHGETPFPEKYPPFKDR